MRILTTVASVLSFWSAAARADSPPAPLPAPLTEAEQAIFMGSAEDVLDKPVCGADARMRVTTECKDRIRYVHTNEFYLDEFTPYMRGLGGGYVGVGSDQGLTLVAFSRAELAWFMDYDPVVVAMNRIIRAFVLGSDDPAAFVARWGKGRATDAAGVKLLEEEYAGHPDLALMLDIHDDYRDKMRRYFESVARNGKRRRRFHFLHDPADYAYVRGLYQAGRIRVLGGDLLKEKGVTGIAAAAKSLGVTIRVLYLSNAEQYWNYTQQFRDNMNALPFDDKSVVLRLLWNQRWGPEKLGPFFYVVQAGKDFQQKLQVPARKRVSKMMPERVAGRTGVFAIGLAAVVRKKL